MKRLSVPLLLSAAVVLLMAADSENAVRVWLPSSKALTTPVPGHLGYVNSFPSNIAVAPGGAYAAVLNDGYGTQDTGARQSISVVDLKTGKIEEFPDDRLSESAHQSYFVGIGFSSDGSRLYASMGSISDPNGEKKNDTGNGIAVYEVRNGKLKPERFLKIPPQTFAAGRRAGSALANTAPGTVLPYPAGLAVIGRDGRDQLLVANNLSDNAVLMDAASGEISQRFDLSTHAMIPSSLPYTVVASRDGRRAWCSLWNASRVAELDLISGRVTRWIPLLDPEDSLAPGSHPTALLLSPDEGQLYVALSEADKVAVVSTADGKAMRYLETNLPGEKYAGTYPVALAQTQDGKRLFVADSSLNAVAVFDVSAHGEAAKAQSALGFIPTEWYPSALAVSGDDLLIATAKGKGTGPNNGLSVLKNERRHREHPYIPTLMRGSIARLKIQDLDARLAEYTRRVEQDNLLHAEAAKIEFRAGGNPIRHVIYILKENRTYDQIFGDLGVGDGDKSLTMYGEDVTPNHHKLARQFGVLDNFYDSGEVSGNGHVWTSAAITNEYNEHTWQIAYRGRERIYDFGGTVADEYPLELSEADVNEPATGYLWDNLARSGLSYRYYGEYLNAEWCNQENADTKHADEHSRTKPETGCERTTVKKGEALAANVGAPHGGPSPWPWAVPVLKRMRPTKRDLRDHYDPLYPDFNTQYPDQLRADEFLNEFEGFVRNRGQKGEMPAFIMLYLPNDHTAAKRPGQGTPSAMVADNDLAVGRVVEAVSNSKYWDDTAIFALEDDAQDGADHVDAHRSTALVISKYSPGSVSQPFVDHHFYTTVSMVHTLETLIGLQPMNQNDAHAPVMGPLFVGAGNQPAFHADWRNRDNGLIYQMNPGRGPEAEASEKMDFSRPDAANAEELNAILWRDRKGTAPMPEPKHTVFARDSEGD